MPMTSAQAKSAANAQVVSLGAGGIAYARALVDSRRASGTALSAGDITQIENALSQQGDTYLQAQQASLLAVYGEKLALDGK